MRGVPCSWAAPGGGKQTSTHTKAVLSMVPVGFLSLTFSRSLLYPGEHQREPQSDGFLGQSLLLGGGGCSPVPPWAHQQQDGDPARVGCDWSTPAFAWGFAVVPCAWPA